MRILVSILCLSLLIAIEVTAKIVVASYVAEEVKSIFVMEDDGTGITTILTDTRYPTAPRWSPDGKQIVFARFLKPGDWDRKQIFIVNADGTNERFLTKGAQDGNPVFSPDGTSVLFYRYERIDNKSKRSVNVIDLVSGKIKKIADFGVNFPDWSPDGKQIAYSGIPVLGKTGSNLWIMDADGGRPRELLPQLPLGEVLIQRGGYARWSPNGKQIVYGQYESKFNPNVGFIPQANRYFIYDLFTRQSKQLRIPKTYFPSALDWMDNGKSILFSAREVELDVPVEGLVHPYHLYKYDIATGRITRLSEQTWLNPSLDWISDDVLSVSPEGKMQTQWGAIKKFLQSRSETFKLLSQDVLFFLRNER